MYNTPQEIHIAIDQALQYVNTNRKSVLKPEEKDWVFNETMLRVVDSIISAHRDGSGYEDNILTYDALKPLKSKQHLTPISINSDFVKFRIPSDYKDTSSIGVKVKPTCYTKVDNIQYDVNRLVIDLGDGGDAPYYSNFNFSITYSNGDVVNLVNANELNVSSGFNSTTLKYMFVNFILEAANNNPNIDIYWERYNNEYYRNSFIIFVNTDIVGARITYDSYDKIVLTSTVNISSSDYNTNGFNRPTTVITTEEKHELLNHMFGTTSIDKPLITLDEDDITVYINKDFNVYELELEYIRRPILLNYKANIMTELSIISNEIVQRTVQAIKARTNDSNYKAIINENLLNKNI